MGTLPPPSRDDRRGGERQLTCYPLGIQRGDPGDTSDMEIAVVHDLSVTGALVLVGAALPLGARVKLHFDIFEDPAELVVVEGTVVRVEARNQRGADSFNYGVAVEFTSPEPRLAPGIERIAALAREA